MNPPLSPTLSSTLGLQATDSDALFLKYEAPRSPSFHTLALNPNEQTPMGVAASPNRVRARICISSTLDDRIDSVRTAGLRRRSTPFSALFQPIEKSQGVSSAVFRNSASASPNATLLSEDVSPCSLISPAHEDDYEVGDHSDDSDDADISWGRRLLSLLERNQRNRATRRAIQSRKRKPVCRSLDSSFSGIKLARTEGSKLSPGRGF